MAMIIALAFCVILGVGAGILFYRRGNNGRAALYMAAGVFGAFLLIKEILSMTGGM